MKTLFCLLISLVMVTMSWGTVLEETVKWDMGVSAAGDTTTYDITATDTLSILGAGYTIYSKKYWNIGGSFNLQFSAWGGTTAKYKVIVEGAVTYRDSLRWKPYYWVDFDGYSIDSCLVRITDDSCTVMGTSVPITIPTLACPYFRFKVTGTPLQSGNTQMSAGLSRSRP